MLKVNATHPLWTRPPGPGRPVVTHALAPAAPTATTATTATTTPTAAISATAPAAPAAAVTASASRVPPAPRADLARADAVGHHFQQFPIQRPGPPAPAAPIQMGKRKKAPKTGLPPTKRTAPAPLTGGPPVMSTVVPMLTDSTATRAEGLMASGDYQKTLDEITPELVGAGVLDLSQLEERFRSKTGRVTWKRPGTPKSSISMGPGLIHKPQPRAKSKKKVHAEAPPPGWQTPKTVAEPGEIDMFDFAFKHGLPTLVSKIGHEATHLRQYQSDEVPGTGPIPGTVTGQTSSVPLTGMQEVEAHHWEIMNADRTGLDQDLPRMEEIYGWLKHYNSTLSTAEKQRVAHLFSAAQGKMKALRAAATTP